MFERYRVLGAMLALKEFTAEDLATRADVSRATVRTVIHRQQSDLEVIGVLETGRRGGQPRRYHLKQESVGALMAELRSAENEISAKSARFASPGGFNTDAEVQGLPSPLEALPAEVELARDILLDEVPGLPPGEDRRWRVALAQTAIQGASHVLQQSPNADDRSRGEWVLSFFDFLADLALTEDALYVDAPEDVLNSMKTAASDLKMLLATDDDLLSDWVRSLRERVIESPTAKVLLEAAPEIMNGMTGETDWRSKLVVLLDAVGEASPAATNWLEDLLQKYKVDVRRLTYDVVDEQPHLTTDSDATRTPFFQTAEEDATPTGFNPVFVYEVNSTDPLYAREAIKHVSSLSSGVGEFFVVSDQFDPILNNEVNSRSGHFLPTQGLTDRGVLGALGVEALGPPQPGTETSAH